jgi:hypothetical protein
VRPQDHKWEDGVSETALRWQGRLSRLRSFSLLIGIGALALVFAGLSMFSAAQRNDPSRPWEVTVGQLVRGEVATSRYVTVPGVSDYDVFYTEAEGGKTVGSYYFLFDEELVNIILVEADSAPEPQSDLVPARITGMTRVVDTGLRDLVRSDLDDIHAAGLETNVDLYIGEGEKPPSKGTVLGLLCAAAALFFLAVTPLFAPRTVFGVAPLQPVGGPVAGDPGARAIGSFQQVRNLEPLELGQRRHRFDSAVANLIPLQDRQLFVYIHNIVTTRAYGVKVGQQESHWGVLLGRDNVVAIDPGRLYAWKERPAVRLRYRDADGREQELVVSFDHAAAQVAFVGTLQQLGFAVGSGMPTAL